MSRYSVNVFINCPFDSQYDAIFKAIVFTVQDCGFIPRCAFENDDGSQIRIEKLYSIIKNCNLGIHDISRTDLDPINDLPRFNMPFELGVFLGAKYFGPKAQKNKKCLILDKERFRFQKFISDIAGQDIHAHENHSEQAIKIVRDWLQTILIGKKQLPAGKHIIQRYNLFQNDLPEICASSLLDHRELVFNEYVFLISEWLDKNAWKKP